MATPPEMGAVQSAYVLCNVLDARGKRWDCFNGRCELDQRQAVVLLLMVPQ